MRQSLAQFEREFLYETARDQRQREHLRRDVAVRSRRRLRERRRRRSSIRFWVLALSLVATALAVTGATFTTLYYLLS